MTMLATTKNAHAGNLSSLSHTSVAATGTRMIGPDILRSLAVLLVMLVHLLLNATPAYW